MSDKNWTYKKCECGHPSCNDYFLSFTRSDGRVTLEEAKLIVAAPKLLEALKGIIDIGKRDMSNPKYDTYFRSAKEILKQLK